MNAKLDIYKHLKQNNRIVWASTLLCAVISLFSIWTASNAISTAEKLVYGLSADAELLPLELMDQKKVESTFKKGHIELFLGNFYAYDQWNYKERIEKALWLIDSEPGKKLYEFYKQDGHFNRIIQSASSQRIYDIKPVLDSQGNFEVTAIIEINKNNQSVSNRYRMLARGKLVEVSQNYPLNPYGYTITNFKEITKKKIANE